MITIISGTNRNDNNTKKVALEYRRLLAEKNVESTILALDEVNLKFTDGALHAIAKEAQKRELGARALRAIIEEFMLDIMYEVPKDDEIGTVTITEDYVEKKGGPVIEMRTADKALPKPQKVAEGNA